MKTVWNWLINQITSLNWELICKRTCLVLAAVLVLLGSGLLFGWIKTTLGAIIIVFSMVLALRSGFILTFVDSGAYMPVGNGSAITRVVDGTKPTFLGMGVAWVGIPFFQQLLPINIHVPKAISKDGDIEEEIKTGTGLWKESVVSVLIKSLELNDGVQLDLRVTLTLIVSTADDALECLTTLKQRHYIKAVEFIKDIIVGHLVQISYLQFLDELANKVNGKSLLDRTVLAFGQDADGLYNLTCLHLESVAFSSFELTGNSIEILNQQRATKIALERIRTEKNNADAEVEIARGKAEMVRQKGLAEAETMKAQLKGQLEALDETVSDEARRDQIKNSLVFAEGLAKTTGTVVVGGNTPIALPAKSP